MLGLLSTAGGRGRGPSPFDGLGMEMGRSLRPVLPGLVIATASAVIFAMSNRVEPDAAVTFIRYVAWGGMGLGVLAMCAGMGYVVLDRLGLLHRWTDAAQTNSRARRDEGDSHHE